MRLAPTVLAVCYFTGLSLSSSVPPRLHKRNTENAREAPPPERNKDSRGYFSDDEPDYYRINPKCEVYSRGFQGPKKPSSTICVDLTQTVNELATDIIQLFQQQEQTIGFYVTQVWKVDQDQLKLFTQVLKTFEGSEPSILEFVRNITAALDQDHLITNQVEKDLTYLGQLATGNDTLPPLNDTLPGRIIGNNRKRRSFPELELQLATNASLRRRQVDFQSDQNAAVVMERLEIGGYMPEERMFIGQRRKRSTHEQKHAHKHSKKKSATGRKIAQIQDSHKCSQKNDTIGTPGKPGAGSSGPGNGGGGGGGEYGGSSSGNYTKWWGPIQRVVSHLQGTINWLAFLQEFGQVLHTYETQLARLNGTKGSFSGWITTNEITNITLTNALELISQEYKLKSLENNIQPLVTAHSQTRLSYLNEMVRATLKIQTKCSKVKRQMNVTGSFVFISEVVKCFNSTTDNVTKVMVVAANKLFIDEDINATEIQNRNVPYDMTVLAPGWSVIGGKRTLSFSGTPGPPPPDEPKPEDRGKPGHPGGPGSNFYAIVMNVTGGDVEVLVNGGQGGRGFKGGEKPMADVGCKEGALIVMRTMYKKPLGGYEWKKNIACEATCPEYWGKYRSLQPVSPRTIGARACTEFCVRFCCWEGPKFVRPGDAGGQGGAGGNPGYVEVVSVSSPSEAISNVISGGANGTRGPPGAGGTGSLIDPKDRNKEDETYLKAKKIWDYEEHYLKRWCCNRNERNVSIKEYYPTPPVGPDGGDPRPPQGPTKVAEFSLYSVMDAILEYKIMSRLGSHLFSRPQIRNYTEYMEQNKSLNKVFQTIHFVQEFLDLERQIPEIIKYPTSPLVDYYASISRRAIGRILQMQEKGNSTEPPTTPPPNMTRAQITSDDERALLFVHAAAESKKLAFRSPFDPFHITNILDFLAAEKTTSQELQKTVEIVEQYQYMHQITDSYDKSISKLFDEAFYFIKNVMDPELASIRDYFGRLFEFILKLIEELKKQGAVAIQKLMRYRMELITHTALTVVFNLIDLTGTVVGFMNSWGRLITRAGGFVQDLIPGPNPPPSFDIPSVILSGLGHSALKFRRAAITALKGFLLQMQVVRFILEIHPETFKTSLTTINETNATVMEYLFDPDQPTHEFAPQDSYNSYRLWIGLDTVIREGQENVSKAIQNEPVSGGGNGSSSSSSGRAIVTLHAGRNAQNHHHHHQHTHHGHKILKRQSIPGTEISIMQAAMWAFQIAQQGYGYWTTLRDNIESIREVAQSIEGVKGLLMALEEYEKRVQDGLITDVHDLFTSLNDLSGDLTDKSKTALDIMKWRIQSVLRDMKLEYTNAFTKGFIIEPYMKRAFERIEEVVTKMVDIFENLVNYQDQAKLANFTAQANQNPGYLLGKLNDENLEVKVNALRFMLQGGVVLKRHTLAASSFRYWSFPFVTPSLCNLNIGQLVSNDLTDHTQLSVMLGTILSRTNEMIQTVEDRKNGINPWDKYIVKSPFTHEKPHRPFYRWSNATHYEEIKNLLQGKQVNLFAKAEDGPKSCEAIKFSRIAIYFVSARNNEEEEKKLAEDLGDYKLEMIHAGTSYYVFANQSYVLEGQELRFSFSFALDNDGIPVIKNGVYDKMLSGDITISPFASWAITITAVNNDEDTADIKPFVGLVDLFLEGDGVCVDRRYAQDNTFARPDCSDYGKY